MIINYRSLHKDHPYAERQLREHAEWLAAFDPVPGKKDGNISEQPAPSGYENYFVVDVIGSEFVWMNETFPKDKFTWYIWFESVFLVPEEMVTFLKLRWS